MAVLNLIIDKAPTSPSDKTILDLIVTTIKKIEIPKIKNKLAVVNLLETVF